MANNKIYGYSPKAKNEKDGNRLDRVNPYEFRKGMDYELTNLGCSRLAESTPDEREKSTEKVLKNLGKHPSFYSNTIQYETIYRNHQKGNKKPSFNKWLKDRDDNQMKPVGEKFKNDKMVTLKEAIKIEIRRILREDKQNTNEITPAQQKYVDKAASRTSKPKKTQFRKDIEGAKRMIDAGKSEDEVAKKYSQEAINAVNAENEYLQEDKREDNVAKQVSNDTGIIKSITDTKDALTDAQQKLNDLKPRILALGKETNDKIKANPEGKLDYLQTYKTNPDVAEYLVLRSMLKDAGFLTQE